MAHRRLFVTDAGAGFYRTRMLSAGDPITLSGPESRLQMALGNVTDARPRRRAAVEVPAPAAVIPTVDEVLGAQVVKEPARPAKKAAPRRKAKK